MLTSRISFLSQNTQIIDSDRRGNRPKQWARYIEPNFDLVCLQEVWTNRAVRRLLREFSTKPYVHDRNAVSMVNSSGLVTLSWGNKISNRDGREYNRQAGWDRLASKGVILTEADTGISNSRIQIYNTHLNAARDLRRTDYIEDRLVTVRQLYELGKFIIETRKHHLPAIVCGDFNLDGENPTLFPINLITGDSHASADGLRRGLNDRFWDNIPNNQGVTLKQSLTRLVPDDYLTTRDFGDITPVKSQYQLIVDMFRVLGFKDAWSINNPKKCYTTKLGQRDSEDITNFKLRMAIMATPDQDANSIFAVDSPLYAKYARRLDYVFFSSGNGSNSCKLNIPEIRRTYIPVPGQNNRFPFQNKWMSDHVGLACQLVFTQV